jgi:hypothetical protein
MNRKSFLITGAVLAIVAGSATVHAESGGGGGGDSGAPAMMLPPANSAPVNFNPAEPRTDARSGRTDPLSESRTFERFKDGGWVMTTTMKDGRSFLRFRTANGRIESGFGEFLGKKDDGTSRWRLTNSKGEVKIFAATADGKGTAILGVGLTR